MMHPSRLFRRIHDRNNYRHIGKALSYKFFVVSASQTIYLCFQGSNGLTDWLHNFLAIPKPQRFMSATVHAGFLRAWRSGSDTVMKELLALTERLPNFKIVFCGFSHGAAIAQLAAHNWFTCTGNRCQCVIFGSPKLAWGAETQRLLNDSMTLTNWINPADVVTAVPLHRWGFRHVRMDFVKVRRIPLLSKLRVYKHHQIYSRKEIYPENWRRKHGVA
jgi:hypothetical protein